MGSTVVVGRRVGVIKTKTQMLYCLFESGYEVNVYPHTVSESCCAFGTLQAVMVWIMRAMSSCSSGMTRGRGGSLSPMGYLKMWQDALKAPADYWDRKITLKASREFRATVPLGDEGSYWDRNMVPFTCEQLRKHGYSEQATALEAGHSVELNLWEDGDVLADIYGNIGSERIAPWRILEPRGFMAHNPENAAPKNASKGAALPQLYSLGIPPWSTSTEWFVAIGADGWSTASSKDGLIGDYLDHVAVKLERESAGVGVASVTALAADLRKPLPHLPQHYLVELDLRKCLQHEWYREQFDLVVATLGQQYVKEPGLLVVPYAEVAGKPIFKTMADSYSQGLKFQVPTTAAMQVNMGTETLDMFAAAA